jgi:hypothetical protein
MAMAEASAAAIRGFDSYVRDVEARLERQHRSDLGFLVGVDAVSPMRERLRRGEVVAEPVTKTDGALPGAMLHHWRGTAFVAGAKAGDFERLLRDFPAYPKVFAPEVLSAKVLGGGGERMQMSMRVRQKHVITVVMDTSYDVVFGRMDAGHGYSVSRSTRVAEIESPGTSSERVLLASEEHGFLWRQNTYWSYAESDGGLYVQIESVSLSRSIPHGLAWAVGPFVESVPRESMEFTLLSVCSALRK